MANPRNRWTALRLSGVGQLATASTLAGSIRMPSGDKINPRNGTDCAWNSHFSSLANKRFSRSRCHTSLCKKDRRTQVLCKTEEWSLLQNFRMITSKTETQSSGEEQGSQCPHQLDRWLGGNDRKDVSLTLPIRPRYPAD